MKLELTYKVFNWTHRVGVVRTLILMDLLWSGSRESNSSFFTKAFIPASLLYRVRTGKGGIRSSLLAAFVKLTHQGLHWRECKEKTAEKRIETDWNLKKTQNINSSKRDAKEQCHTDFIVVEGTRWKKELAKMKQGAKCISILCLWMFVCACAHINNKLRAYNDDNKI